MKQMGPPEAIYRLPETRFVAGFLGQSNIWQGQVESVSSGLAEVALNNGARLRVTLDEAKPTGTVEAVLRAHRVQIDADRDSHQGKTVMMGRVTAVNHPGDTPSCFIDAGGTEVQAIHVIQSRVFGEGDEVAIHVRPQDCVLLDEMGERIG